MNNHFDTYDTGTITYKIDNAKIQNAIFTGNNLSVDAIQKLGHVMCQRKHNGNCACYFHFETKVSVHFFASFTFILMQL